MMIYDKRTLPNVIKTKSQEALEKQIDWTKFKFYKDRLGLRDFTEELYPKHFYKYNNTSDPHTHPMPYAHYKWVKDIVFKSETEVPMPMYGKLKTWSTTEIKAEDWMSKAKAVSSWEKNA